MYMQFNLFYLNAPFNHHHPFINAPKKAEEREILRFVWFLNELCFACGSQLLLLR